jgi:predicted NBD/HSP70 family sugar kinase
VESVNIVKAALGKESGIIGAAALAKEIVKKKVSK